MPRRDSAQQQDSASAAVRREQVPGQQDTLKQHYEAAVRFQRSGDAAQASVEYRLFLGEALHPPQAAERNKCVHSPFE